jgi:hypothetical protein
LLKLYLRRGSLAFFAPRTHARTRTHIRARRTRNLVCEKYHQRYIILNRVCSSSGGAFSLLIISYRCRFFLFPFPPTGSSSSSDAKFDLHVSFMRAHLIPKPISLFTLYTRTRSHTHSQYFIHTMDAYDFLHLLNSCKRAKRSQHVRLTQS